MSVLFGCFETTINTKSNFIENIIQIEYVLEKQNIIQIFYQMYDQMNKVILFTQKLRTLISKHKPKCNAD